VVVPHTQNEHETTIEKDGDHVVNIWACTVQRST